MNAAFSEGPPRPEKVTVQTIRSRKGGDKLTMLTAYDYPVAKLLDDAGLDIILVGDSLGMVVLGEEGTTGVTLADMIRHGKAARRGVSRALLVVDLPYESIHGAGADIVGSSRHLLTETRADAVKLEWADGIETRVPALVAVGIAVMGHVGLTPQTVEQEGGFGIRGKDAASAKRIFDQALALERAGCFALVLECIPDELAAAITARLRIPTIGIGSGVRCDGQVLVTYDILGLFERFRPRFVKRYANLADTIRQAAGAFAGEVRAGSFPAKEHTVSMAPDALETFRKRLET